MIHFVGLSDDVSALPMLVRFLNDGDGEGGGRPSGCSGSCGRPRRPWDGSDLVDLRDVVDHDLVETSRFEDIVRITPPLFPDGRAAGEDDLCDPRVSALPMLG